MNSSNPEPLANPQNETQHPNFVIDVIGDLPYYVPVPEGFSLSPSLIGAEPFKITFTHFKPLRHPDDSKGENVDDRLGTFIRSRCQVSFPRIRLPNGEFRDDFEKKALDITNNALRAIRYKAYDPAIRYVSRFNNCIIQTKEFNPDGSIKPLKQVSQKADYGPFGIQLLGTLKNDALRDIWWLFNGLSSMPSSWLLVLDSRYHNLMGDITHACLDIATALEINIDGLINNYESLDQRLLEITLEDKSIYWKYDTGLKQATGHSLREHPDLFVNLEYIYGIRNSIAHAWKPVFKVTKHMKNKSIYLDKHLAKDGYEISNSKEVEELIKSTEEILVYTRDLFRSKYELKNNPNLTLHPFGLV